MLRCLMLTLLLIAAPLAGADTFVFTAIPDEDETRLQARFQKVADYLADELEVDVRFVPVKSYAAAVTAFRNNQVQLAWFGASPAFRRVSGYPVRKRWRRAAKMLSLSLILSPTKVPA